MQEDGGLSSVRNFGFDKEKIDQVIEKEEELPTVLDNKEEEELPSFEAINEVEEKEEEITRTLPEIWR